MRSILQTSRCRPDTRPVPRTDSSSVVARPDRRTTRQTTEPTTRTGRVIKETLRSGPHRRSLPRHRESPPFMTRVNHISQCPWGAPTTHRTMTVRWTGAPYFGVAHRTGISPGVRFVGKKICLGRSMFSVKEFYGE